MAKTPPTIFKPVEHHCEVCGSTKAPFGEDRMDPMLGKRRMYWYCRDHLSDSFFSGKAKK